jgi:aspartyl-tRNA(Asn)/glutamyl-tRNA(Gln) amidotransferase subunit A
VLSNAGTIPLAESYDTAGPITQTVADAQTILRTLSPVGCPPLLPSQPLDLAKLRVGVARNLATEMEPDVATCFESAVQRLVKLVAYIEDVPVEVEPAWAVRNFEIFRYHQQMFERTPQLYQPRTLDRVRGSAGVSEIEYVRQRESLKTGLPADSLFEKLDLILSPTVPVSAPLLSDVEGMDSAALRAYEVKSLLGNTLPFSFLWWPTISVPCGFTKSGLPVGLQISGRPGDDWRVLQFAEVYEQSTR